MRNLQIQRGMTLIELMVVVAIVAILAGIAYPSYRNSVMKSNRTEAKVALNKSAETLEKCFTRFNTYKSASCTDDNDVAKLIAGNSFDTPAKNYKITGSINSTDYTLTATAIGAQANDTTCAKITLDDANKSTPSGCW